MKKSYLTLLIWFVTVITCFSQISIDDFYEEKATLLIKSTIIEKNEKIEDLKEIAIKWSNTAHSSVDANITDSSISFVIINDLSDHRSDLLEKYAVNVVFDFKPGKVRMQLYDVGEVRKSSPLGSPHLGSSESVKDPFKKRFRRGVVKGHRYKIAKAYLQGVNAEIDSFMSFAKDYSSDW